MNTISFCMRILCATYNCTVEKELATQRFPFKYVYTGVEGTTKRAIPLRVMEQLRMLDLLIYPAKRFTRDTPFFSLYTRGTPTADMAFLGGRDLGSSIFTYRREKTGQ